MYDSKNITFLWLLPFCLASAQSMSPYRIVIDGGSTGSRLHVFEFVEDEDTNEVECIRRGSSRADVPLSAFGRSDSSIDSNSTNNDNGGQGLLPQVVAEHLLPLFEYAANVIPSIHHNSTQVKYQATAGMRLLTPEGQEEVYDALYQGLVESPTFVFDSLERSDIATLSGELEGFYGAIAANYLQGIVDVNLHTKVPVGVKEHEQQQQKGGHQHHHGPIGALDMGGSSTQIVFSTKEVEATMSCPAADSDNDVEETCPIQPSRLDGDDFFATSYLSYGVDQFRERLWTTWVNDQRQYQDSTSCISKVIDNPCTFKGYEIEWEGYTLIGTGDAHECVKQVQRLIPHHEEVYDHQDDSVNSEDGEEFSFVVGGVQHPPLQGKFFAMSLYFFTLDSLRELSHPSKEAHEALNLSWPTPSIDELFNALDGLCSRSWEGDLEEIQHEAHAFTKAEVLPHRCLESVYMVTLLRDGFGFHPESRDITFTFLVDGSEVEWSLGMALSLYAEEQQHAQSDGTSSHSSTVTTGGSETNMTSDEEDEESQDCELSKHTSMTCPSLLS